MSQAQTHDTPQEMQNMSFDETFQVSEIELLGHDSSANVLRRVQVDSSGNLKIDPTNLDSRYLKFSVAASEPSSPTEGQMYLNTSDHKLYIYYPSSWQELHTLTAPVTGNPIGLLLSLTYA